MSYKKSFWATLPGCLVLIFIALAGYSLLRGHSSHLLQWAPFLIILLCPLMHLFMHRGHGHSTHDTEPDRSEKRNGSQQSNDRFQE